MRIPQKTMVEVTARQVSFGNPSLGTLHGGCVYTYNNSHTYKQERHHRHGKEAEANTSIHKGNHGDGNDKRTDVDAPIHHHGDGRTDATTGSDSDEFDRMVAMCDVPAEQVPEGILNFSRSHRQSIESIRILITEKKDVDDENENDNNKDEAKLEDEKTLITNTNDESKSSSSSLQVDGFKFLSLSVDSDDTNLRTYLILISFQTAKAAMDFVDDLHTKPYTSFERHVVANIYHVKKLVDQDKGHEKDDSIHSHGDLLDTRGGSQNCPVCLEKMENVSSDLGLINSSISQSPAVTSAPTKASTSGGHPKPTLTTVCNHTFHMECLSQCVDSPCPVCRYDHSGLNDHLSRCHVCGTTENIHVCLICGVASCWNPSSDSASCDAGKGKGSSKGRGNDYAGSTILHDYQESNLASSGNNDTCMPAKSFYPGGLMQSENNTSCDNNTSSYLTHVGGHARDHYNETLHAYALNTETQHVWDFAGQGYVHRLIQNIDDGKLVEVSDPTNTTSQERSLVPHLSDSREEEVVHRKLEGLANQYHTLLKSQLEQQRLYFESVLENMKREHEEELLRNKRRASTDLIAALKQERNQLQHRHVSMQTKYAKASDEVTFLKNMNESLEANKEPMRRKIEEAQRKRIEFKNTLQQCKAPLEEKMRQLMSRLENE